MEELDIPLHLKILFESKEFNENEKKKMIQDFHDMVDSILSLKRKKYFNLHNFETLNLKKRSLILEETVSRLRNELAELKQHLHRKKTKY
jgi:hypothetical protein